MNHEIKFTCSHCEQKMVVDAAAIGLTITCPGCGNEQIVPAEAAVQEAPAPAPEPQFHTPQPQFYAPQPRPAFIPEDRPAPRTATVSETIAGGAQPEPAQDLIAATVQNSRLEGQVGELRQQIKKLRSDLSRVTAERDEAMAQTQQMAPELDVAREHLQAYAAAVDSLQQQVRQAEADVAEARQHLADTQEERTVALRDIQALQQRSAAQDAEQASLWAELTKATGKVESLEADLVKVRESLASAEHGSEVLRGELADLTKDRDSLRRSLSESGMGQELVSIREQLATAEKECKRLSLHSRQLASDVEANEKARKERDDLIRTLKTELDGARRSAAASSKTKTDNDNEVLRGIIARQNVELEQRHVQLVRLKRARLGVQFAYAAFALALVGIIIWAVKMVPKLKPGSLLDF
jgi:chromosome segregation ATPase